MKNKLPVNKKRSKSLFPKFFLIFTEQWKLLAICFACILIIIAIILQSIKLYSSFKEAQKIESARNDTVKELNYWKQTAAKYKDYRDVYFRIAALEYKLGDSSQTKIYIKKALDLDPNFKEAKILGAKVGLNVD